MAILDRIRDSRIASDRMQLMARKAAGGGNVASAVGDSFMAAAVEATSTGGGAAGSTRGVQSALKHFTGHQYTAISAIAKRIAAQPLYVASNKSRASAGPRHSKRLITKSPTTDGLEPIPNHALLDLIDDPNPVMVRWSLLYTTVACLQLTGMAYWWITDGDGGKQNLWPIPPHWIQPKDVLRRTWLVRPFGRSEPIEVPGEQIAFFNLPDPADPFGSISPLQAQAPAISADEAIQNAQVAAFKNGIRPGVIVRTGKQPLPPGQSGEPMRPLLTQGQKRQIINAIQSAYRGVVNDGNPVVLDGLIESVERFSLAPDEMDFMESSKLTRGRIFQAFGVNPLIVGEIEGANRAQAVVAEESFCSNVCNPLLTLMSQVLTAWVGPLFGEGLSVWFEPCRAHDAELESKDWAMAVAKGAVTRNEIRVHRLGLPPHDDPAADELPDVSSAVPAISATARQAAETVKQALTVRRKTGPLVDPYTLKPLALPAPTG